MICASSEQSLLRALLELLLGRQMLLVEKGEEFFSISIGWC